MHQVHLNCPVIFFVRLKKKGVSSARKGELRDEVTRCVHVHLCLHVRKYLCKFKIKEEDFRDILNCCVCVPIYADQFNCICLYMHLCECTYAYVSISGSLLQWICVRVGDGGPLSSICWIVTSPPNHLASDSTRSQLASRSILMSRTRRLLQGAIVEGANLCFFQGAQHQALQTSQHG